MPMWKKALFARLHRPIDGEGNDLGGGSATMAAMDAIGTDAPDDQSETIADNADAASDAEQNNQQDATPEDAPKLSAMDKVASFMDTLTGEAKPEPTAEEKAAEAAKAAATKAPEAAPKTAEQEEAELLEGVKSDRGRERIQKVFAERKQLEQDVTQFKEMVQSTGMSPQEFAQTLEFGRLSTSDDPQKLAVALEMVEQQRADLYARLGKEAPGVDLLKDHADLANAVENMEITRERAVELAKHRRAENIQRQQQQVVQQSQQEQARFQQTVQSAASQMEAYLQTRASEVDHLPRMKVITEHFKNPANMQAFLQNNPPEQWGNAIKWMYDNIQGAPRAATPSHQPIRSRPASLGVPAAAGNTPIDRVAQRLEGMGI